MVAIPVSSSVAAAVTTFAISISVTGVVSISVTSLRAFLLMTVVFVSILIGSSRVKESLNIES